VSPRTMSRARGRGLSSAEDGREPKVFLHLQRRLPIAYCGVSEKKKKTLLFISKKGEENLLRETLQISPSVIRGEKGFAQCGRNFLTHPCVERRKGKCRKPIFSPQEKTRVISK